MVCYPHNNVCCTIQGVPLTSKTDHLYGDGADSGPVISVTRCKVMCKRNTCNKLSPNTTCFDLYKSSSVMVMV